MAEKTIKQRIELTGEKQYTAAVKDAGRQLKVLQSQLKAESAELGKNASEQQKAEVKAKNLTKQITEQEKIVETLQQALEQAKKEYGDNAEVVGRWEIKLNNARAVLGGMRGDLENLNTGLNPAEAGFKKVADAAGNGATATRSFAEALGSIADAGGAISDKIQGIFTGMVTTVKDAISSVWEDTMELAGRANEWADLAGIWNTSAANIQKWYHSVNASHNDFATLNSAVTRIVMADQKKITENAHVSAEGYADQWEYAMAVMDSLASMDYDQKLAALGEIFGEKRATGVLDLLNDWETIKKSLDEFDVEKGGVGMTEEQMSDMAKLAEQVDHIKETWAAFKDSFLAGAVGKLSLDLTGNVQGALDALISFMNAENEADREKALEEFTTNITEFFTRLGEAITKAAEALGAAGEQMQGSENGIVKALGDVLVALRDTMNWFADEGNIQLVIKGFEALAAFWLAGRGLQMGMKIAELVKNIAVIKAFNMGGGGGGVTGGGGGGTGGGATGGGTDTVAVSNSGSWFGKLLSSTGAKVAGGTAAFGLTLFGDLLREAVEGRGEVVEDENGQLRDAETGKALNTGAQEYELSDAAQEKARENEKRRAQQKMDLLDQFVEYVEGEKTPEKLEELLEQDGGEALLNRYNKYRAENGLGSLGWDQIPEEFRQMLEDERLQAEHESIDTVEESLDAKYGREEIEGAIQDWWDAWKQNDLEPTEEGAAEEDREWNLMQEMLGDSFGDVWDRIVEGLDAAEDQHALEDIPEGWYRDILDSLDFGEKEGGVTSEDLSALQGLPALIQAATESGAASGVSGIQVTLDGYSVGRLVAPYVSREIGRSIITMR